MDPTAVSEILRSGRRTAPPGAKFGTVEITRIEPSMASRLVQAAPAPEMARAPPPTTGLLNSVKVSPACSAGPKLVTFTVPLPILFSVPLTITEALAGKRDLSRSTATLPANVRLLFTVKIPTPPAPGDRVPAA